MNARVTLGLIIALIVIALVPIAEAHGRPRRRVDPVGRLITLLLHARDDDDREDAAEDLGRIGNRRALPALDYAAAYDEDRSVRRDARKAARKIRERMAVARPRAVRRRVVVRPKRLPARRPRTDPDRSPPPTSPQQPPPHPGGLLRPRGACPNLALKSLQAAGCGMQAERPLASCRIALSC